MIRIFGRFANGQCLVGIHWIRSFFFRARNRMVLNRNRLSGEMKKIKIDECVETRARKSCECNQIAFRWCRLRFTVGQLLAKISSTDSTFDGMNRKALITRRWNSIKSRGFELFRFEWKMPPTA